MDRAPCVVEGWEFDSLKLILSLTGEHHKRRSMVRIHPFPQAFRMVEAEVETNKLIYVYGLPNDAAIHDGKTPKNV